ncbi:MAG: hypothetical protein IIY78_07285 [Clostridia bacterium]|nr:hypothetical protein [Clostridia bacterium]
MENNFLQLLDNVIGEFSDVKVSAMTGIERTRINRIRKGKFKIEFDELNKIISAFYVEKKDAQNLYDAYLYDKLGADKFKSRQIAKELLSDLSITTNIPQVKITNINLDLPESFGNSNDLAYFQSLASVRNAIIIILLKAQTNGEKIRIISKPDDSFLTSAVFTITSASPTLDIDHLYSLAAVDQIPSPLTYYITTAKDIYPIFMLNTNYKAYYNTSGYLTNELMPFHIITGQYSMSISADFTTAFLTNKHQVIELYSKVFDEKIKNSTSFISHIETVGDYLKHYCSIVQKTQSFMGNLFYSLDYEPCVLSYITKDELSMCIEKMKGQSDILKLISVFIDGFFETFKTNKQVSFFTKKGLHSFLETGKIAEIPEALGLVISPERRVEIISIILDKMKNHTGNKVFYMINENEFDPPMGLRFLGAGYKTDHVFVISNDKDGTRSILSLSNVNIVSIVFDFIESLPESNMVYSNDDAIAYIEDVLNNYK